MPDYLFTYLLNKTIKSRNLNAADDYNNIRLLRQNDKPRRPNTHEE